MSNQDTGDSAREQAARWVLRMTDSSDYLSPRDHAEFEHWLVDPTNAKEFYALSNTTTMLQDLPHAKRWSEEALHETDRAHSRRQVLRWCAVAASFLTVLVLGGIFAKTQGWFGQSYVTRAGETRVVTFQEGSVAYLNTRTELRWIGNERDRRVEFDRGEALFDVVHDETRPFRVMLSDSEIRVLGTRFNIYRKPNGDTTVTVLEGTVEVRGFGNGSAKTEWVRTVHEDQQIEYGPLGLLREPQRTEAQDAVRWRSGVYRFDDQPLEKVLNELTRYTDHRIIIRDPRIAERRVSGALTTRDIRAALKRLEQAAPIEVQESNGDFTLDYRPEAGRRD